MAETDLIRTPDQRLRVFVSSTLQELAAERQAVRDAVTRLRLVPVMFELGARPHPPRQVYRSYMAQSQVFVGVYWQSYGWVAPGEQVSGLEDEYLLSAGLPRLIYVKSPAPERESRLAELLTRMRDAGDVSYQHFSAAAELQRLVENDLAVLLSERFEMAPSGDGAAGEASLAGAVPVPATPLVGRNDDAAAVGDLVGAEGVRLVTLTGPGGVGKSRLAVEVAQRVGPGFEDGVRFVELGSVRAAELVTAAIAAALGLSTSGGRLITDLKSYLRARRLMLVLDNFEQVMGAAPLVAKLLRAAPGVVALVTSRMVLRLNGEHEFPVPPLPVPPIGAGGDAAEVQRWASVRLFVQRAQAASAGFELTSGNAAAVAEICRRLDGLPLAIELAAARVRLLPPQALLARLDDRMGLLTGGARDLPERQRTLRTTLDWSFDLLSGGERALFARLGVFAGTFDLPAAEAVGAAAADPADPGRAGHVMDTLGSLVDSSLVRPQTRDGEPRFGLLETIREYALERLRDGADWREAHDRHAAYFRALAEPAPAELQGPGQLAWLDRLETEHGNLGAAMSWLVEQDQLEAAIQLSWATWRFWWLRGHAGELASYVDILAKSEHLPPRQRALALSGTGFGLFASGDQATPPGIAAPGRAGQRAARTDARPAAGGRQRPARRTRASAAPAGRGARVQFPRPDPAQPGRSRPRSAAVHRGPEGGPQRAGPVHHPRLALRPGAQQPGTGRSDRRGGTPAGRGVAVGRGRGRTKRRLLPRGTGRGRHAAGQPRARRASARRRRRPPASQGQRLAARTRAPRRPRRSLGRAALPHGRCSIRAGLDTGPVAGRQPRH
jgi:predicted ATPase